MSEDEDAAALAEVRDCFDDSAAAERAASPTRLRAAERMHRGYRIALTVPEAFARGATRSVTRDLVERSVRAELAVAFGVSEREVSRRLETAQLLMEHLPLTRALLRDGLILWELGEAICRTASSLPETSRSALDERAADAAVRMTTTQLRRALGRWREELHEQPLAERHARAKEDRAVWVTPDVDGMATLCVYAPAPAVSGAYDRLRRISRTLRDEGDPRTLQQLSADAAVDLLCDGDIIGTTPNDEHRPDPTFVPGVRAEVRLTLAASTAVGLDDAPAELDGYGPVPAPIARELIRTAASFTRVLTDPDTGAVVSAGRTWRTPPPQMRLHLQLRDQTCRFPGCTRTAATSEADHTIEWRNGGETSLENLVMLCTSHHHVRHGEQWSYDRVDDHGTIEWTSPTGRRISNRPPPLPGRPPDPPPGPRFDDAPAPF
ncbi:MULTISPECIES: HNH endonuclease signature motif containing protein [unclassified Rathayibacter]|uniref:HNH endonuclease signature motif containing protein n=1 Tax=unclassified Rathayibacter TaxID=2609250 RepID=UPI001FB2AAE1|nr:MULTISPECIES: HNH endonuclease signature motif containing protein [unclassified Rathayibacter]MCJ1674731.1 HNH endonuclease [Rathayibacter sp. VKM Ac-2929]MCJ1685282.1 HNH endonuclease [Rathayibacter sp. VKM Ac-2928]